MNDPHIDVLSDQQAEFDSVDTKVEKVTLRQRLRLAIARRELRRLVREAPCPTVRNDLLMIAARNERTGR